MYEQHNKDIDPVRGATFYRPSRVLRWEMEDSLERRRVYKRAQKDLHLTIDRLSSKLKAAGFAFRPPSEGHGLLAA